MEREIQRTWVSTCAVIQARNSNCKTLSARGLEQAAASIPYSGAGGQFSL